MKVKFLIPILFTAFIIFMFYYTKIFAFKLYPVCMNFFFFSVFTGSLFTKETVIQKIARLKEGELSQDVKTYTRNLTYVWCVFLFINFLISFATIFMNDKIWLLYNGFISYIMVGTLFIVEYIIRKK